MKGEFELTDIETFSHGQLIGGKKDGQEVFLIKFINEVLPKAFSRAAAKTLYLGLKEYFGEEYEEDA